MPASPHLHRRYPDLLGNGHDPDLTRIVEHLDTIAESIQPPPSLPPTFDGVLARCPEAPPAHIPRRPRLPNPLGCLPRAVTVPAVILSMVILMGAAYRAIPVVERAFFNDAGTQQILNGGLATRLDLTRTIAGYTVTLQRAYADANRIVVGYTVRAPDGHPLDAAHQEVFVRSSLRDAAGHALLPLGGVSVQGGAVLGNFDASSIRGTPTELALQLAIAPPQGSEASPAIFRFTVPFHPGRVATPGQTITAGGTSLTLVRAVISPTEARFYLQGLAGTGIYPHLTVDGWDSNKVPLVGWEPSSAGQVLGTVWENPDGLVVCDFPAALTDKHGTWTLAIRAGPPTADGRKVTGGPWVFRFTVP